MAMTFDQRVAAEAEFSQKSEELFPLAVADRQGRSLLEQQFMNDAVNASVFNIAARMTTREHWLDFWKTVAQPQEIARLANALNTLKASRTLNKAVIESNIKDNYAGGLGNNAQDVRAMRFCDQNGTQAIFQDLIGEITAAATQQASEDAVKKFYTRASEYATRMRTSLDYLRTLPEYIAIVPGANPNGNANYLQQIKNTIESRANKYETKIAKANSSEGTLEKPLKRLNAVLNEIESNATYSPPNNEYARGFKKQLRSFIDSKRFMILDSHNSRFADNWWRANRKRYENEFDSLVHMLVSQNPPTGAINAANCEIWLQGDEIKGQIFQAFDETDSILKNAGPVQIRASQYLKNISAAGAPLAINAPARLGATNPFSDVDEVIKENKIPLTTFQPQAGAKVEHSSSTSIVISVPYGKTQADVDAVVANCLALVKRFGATRTYTIQDGSPEQRQAQMIAYNKAGVAYEIDGLKNSDEKKCFLLHPPVVSVPSGNLENTLTRRIRQQDFQSAADEQNAFKDGWDEFFADYSKQPWKGALYYQHVLKPKIQDIRSGLQNAINKSDGVLANAYALQLAMFYCRLQAPENFGKAWWKDMRSYAWKAMTEGMSPAEIDFLKLAFCRLADNNVYNALDAQYARGANQNGIQQNDFNPQYAQADRNGTVLVNTVVALLHKLDPNIGANYTIYDTTHQIFQQQGQKYLDQAIKEHLSYNAATSPDPGEITEKALGM